MEELGWSPIRNFFAEGEVGVQVSGVEAADPPARTPVGGGGHGDVELRRFPERHSPT